MSRPAHTSPFHAMQWALDQDVPTLDKMILVVLASHYPNIHPSVTRIANKAGCDRSSVMRVLKRLTKAGVIQVASGKGRYRPSVYSLVFNGGTQTPLDSVNGRTETPLNGGTEPPMSDSMVAEGHVNGRTEHVSMVAGCDTKQQGKYQEKDQAAAAAFLSIWMKPGRRYDKVAPGIEDDWQTHGLDTNPELAEQVLAEAREADHTEHPGPWLRQTVTKLKVLAAVQAKDDDTPRMCPKCGESVRPSQQHKCDPQERERHLWSMYESRIDEARRNPHYTLHCRRGDTTEEYTGEALITFLRSEMKSAFGYASDEELDAAQVERQRKHEEDMARRRAYSAKCREAIGKPDYQERVERARLEIYGEAA